MSKQEKKKLSFREVVDYSWRGFLMWWKAAPELILCGMVKEAVNALTPYLPLYFTARLVNAIAAGAAPDEVWRTLALLLVSSVLTGAACSAADA